MSSKNELLRYYRENIAEEIESVLNLKKLVTNFSCKID